MYSPNNIIIQYLLYLLNLLKFINTGSWKRIIKLYILLYN